MARKRRVFFHAIQTLLKPSSSGKGWITQPLLALMTAFLCIVVSPVLAIVPPAPPVPLSLVEQGKTLYEAGKFTEAVKVLQQAASAFEAQGDGLRQALTLSNLALAYQQIGFWSQATEAIRKAIASLHADSLNLLHKGRNTGDSEERIQVLAQALDIQGRLQLAQGQAEQALATWQQAAANYAQAGDQAGVISSRINSVQALQALGLDSRAKTTLIELNETLRSTPDSLTKAVAFRSLGNVLQLVGDLDQSRQFLQQSLEIAQRLQSPQEIGAALLSLGNTARAQQDTKAALTFYQQATTASTSKTTRIQTQLNQLSLLVESNQWSAAQDLWPQIQSELANLPPSRTAVYAQINFAQSLMKLGARGAGEQGSIVQKESLDVPSPPHPLTPSSVAQQLTTAVQQARSLRDQRAEAYALGNLGELYEQNQQWSEAQNLTQQALILAQAINAPDIAYRWQWQLGRLLRKQNNTQGAIAAYTQAVEILQSLRSDLVAINPDIQFSFRESVEPVYRQLVELLLQFKGNEPTQENLDQARRVIEFLQLAELDNFFRVACLQAKPILIDQVIDKEDPTAAVIYPIILPDRLEVILKLPQQPLHHYTTFIDKRQVEAILYRLGQSLTQRNSQETLPLSQQVYDWLIRSAESDLARSKVKTLVFVLDGSLRNIPMAALYDGKQYLVEKYGVALTPGLSLLNPQPLKRQRLKALIAGLSAARGNFPSLRFVPLELAEVQSQVPSEQLFNQAFTSKALQSKINSFTFPVVHLATHGQFSSQAEQTFILTWDDRLNVNQLNNLLRASDQNRPTSSIELLVLSACETVTGDQRAALGLAGVEVRAGARSTLATLWRVNDEATADLMGQFYQELAKTTVTKAEALRLAQLFLLRNPRYKRPHFWAPYVLVGNWL